MSSKKDGVVGTGSALVETMMGSLSGLAFGLISPLASQPFDVLKTKMQADISFRGKGLPTVAKTIFAKDGARGFYRGMLPILLSTGAQKSALFAAYSGSRRWCETSGISWLVDPIPLTGGLRPSILVGGLAAGTARAVVETPFELAKVRTQTGGSFRMTGPGASLVSVGQLREVYTGATATWARGTLMLTSFFVLCDYSVKAAPDLFAQPILGGFLKGGVCATAAWGIAWPLEVVKSRVQCAAGSGPSANTFEMLGVIVRESGVRGLYRGFLPGAMRSFVANGVGMAVYQFTQSLRDD